jgi:hypothetical protein
MNPAAIKLPAQCVRNIQVGTCPFIMTFHWESSFSAYCQSRLMMVFYTRTFTWSTILHRCHYNVTGW